VPEGVSLAPVPATVAELMPQTKGLESAIVEGQVVLVEPRNPSCDFGGPRAG
jgi:hypothetical protein